MKEKVIVQKSKENLYSGYAIAIDEKINEPKSGDLITEIVAQIEGKGIPLVKYDSIPKNQNTVENLKSVSFIVLDWELNPINDEPHDEAQEGLNLGDVVKDDSFEENIKFIESVKKNCFAPIFIFTALAPADVINVLNEKNENLYNTEDESRNFILIRQKKNVTGKKSMFDEIENWINSNPSIYSLKKWENAFYKAKNTLFWDLFDKSPKWPEVLWTSFEDDMVDPLSNFNDTIFRLIMSRSYLSEVDKGKIINEGKEGINKEEIKDVVKEIMYLEATNLNPNETKPGDIFKLNGNYWMNIRPECDTVTGRCDGEIYLIKGSKLTPGQAPIYFKERYSKEMGIHEKHDEVVLFGIDGNDFVVFKLNRVRKENFKELVEAGKRKCRVLHPFINNIQQKYASYSGRVGLPRFPHDLMVETIPELAVNGNHNNGEG